VSRGRWLALGWLALGADYVYLVWQLGRPENEFPSDWHASLNVVLFIGAPVLFVVLLVFSVLWLTGRRRAER
jgi:hypothetical protein